MPMQDYEIRIRRRLRDDFVHYANYCLKVRTKSGDLQKLQLNRAQLHIHRIVEEQKLNTGKVRVIILKGRQQGCSTYVEGRFYWLTTHTIGQRAFILTHDKEATNNIFDMAKRYHDNCPDIFRPTVQASNSKELIFFGIDSGYKLGTAGNKAVGRSSTVQLLHGSEVAYWPNAAEHAKGILQAVPREKGTEVFIESTANGLGNYFFEQWQQAEAGLSEFIAIFVPWFWQAEYQQETDDIKYTDEEAELALLYKLTKEQIAWRRFKIVELAAQGRDGVKAFRQEYPCCAIEAFQFSGEDNLIEPNIVMRARKENITAHGKLYIGVDPAREGNDRTSIIRRRGRVAYGIESYKKKENMEIVGIVRKIILDENPDLVLIDSGMGYGIYDRLVELGFKDILVLVNFGGKALDANKYPNKRCEMWGLMKDWFYDLPVQIPDSDSLHADICSVRYKHDSLSRLALESKIDTKKRGLSPDEADALALTFAMPDAARGAVTAKHYESVSQEFGSQMRRINNLKSKVYG